MTPIVSRSLLVLLTCVVLGGVAGARADSSPDPLRLTELRGQVVLVDFWASWCKPCRQSFPWLNSLQKRYADRGLVVIGVNVDRSHDDAERFLRDFPAAFRILYDPDGIAARHFDVPGMPSSYLIGRDGRVVSRHIGFSAAARDEREAQIDELLSRQAPVAPRK